MNATTRKLIRNALRESKTKNQSLYEFFAKGSRIQNPITVEKMLSVTQHQIDRGEIVQVCRMMDQLNLGNFIAGRRLAASRFMFYYTPTSIGRVALGQSSNLKEIPAPVQQVAPESPKGKRVPSTSSRLRVHTSSSGVSFKIPKDATAEDVSEMAKYIRKNFSTIVKSHSDTSI